MKKKNELEKTDKTDKSEREIRMRAAIKEAAFRLMAEKGLDKVSMREIAEAVNVTKPVLYYYFKNKEDLCYSIIAEHEESFSRRLEETKTRDCGPADLLRQILFSHLDFFFHDPVHSKFVLQMIAYTLDSKHLRPRPEHKNAHEILSAELSQQEKKGRLPKGASQDVMKLVGALSADMMFSSYFHQHVWSGEHHTHNVCYLYGKEDVKRLIDIILLGVAAYYQKSK